jgi:LysR family transcriptional regulator, cyn operon transcriptional activator
MLLRHIRYFLAVAEHRNFTRAAEALHVSQPTLSQQIRQLEDTLHAPLLDRTGRTIVLTDAGVAYLGYARRALQDLEAGRRAIHDVQELSRGALRVAMTPTFTVYLVGRLVETFNRRYPGITLTFQEMTQERMEMLLNDDALDVGIGFDEVGSPDIEGQTLVRETFALMVGKSHPYAKRSRPITLEDFSREVLVLLNSEFATRMQIDRHCRKLDVAPRIAIEANSVSAIVEIVRRGRLATLLPAAIAREQMGLFPVPLEFAVPERTAVLLQRRGAYRTAAARAFVALALETDWDA